MARYRTCLPRSQGKRPTLLYVRYRDMRSRLAGRATNRPDLYDGLEFGWDSFAEFRAWALNEAFPRFSKRLSSPDRQRSTEGYVPGNVVFTTPEHNTRRALHGDDWRGEPGPCEPWCDCDVCIPY
jgi:hypothetical protein